MPVLVSRNCRYCLAWAPTRRALSIHQAPVRCSFLHGADFTAEDVHATFARMIWPPKGISIPRTPLFAAVKEINIVDPSTIAFQLSEPHSSAFMLGAFASGWNIIVRKKTLEDNDYNLRNVPDFPSTAPFKRVRRAMHLIFDRPVLVDVVKDVAPMLVGGFIYPFSEWATPADEMSKRLAYQQDPKASIQETRKLLAEASYANGLKNVDCVVREIATFKLWAVAIQAMLKEALNIDTKLRTVQAVVWFDEAQAGNFDITISAIVSTLMDPSDYFNAR